MRAVVCGIYIVGTGFVCAILALALANRVPRPAVAVVELAAWSLGGYWGYRQARKNEARSAAKVVGR